MSREISEIRAIHEIRMKPGPPLLVRSYCVSIASKLEHAVLYSSRTR
jgi:hypothetical protein